MKANYDSKGDTIQIDLEAVGRIDYGDDEVDAEALIAAAQAALATPDRTVVVDVGVRAAA